MGRAQDPATELPLHAGGRTGLEATGKTGHRPRPAQIDGVGPDGRTGCDYGFVVVSAPLPWLCSTSEVEVTRMAHTARRTSRPKVAARPHEARPNPGRLVFSRYGTSPGASLASIAPGLVDRCGIYVLEFADGAEYVGQTVTVVARFRGHQHNFGDIVAIRFAPCPVGDLDRREIEIMKREERAGKDLRNVQCVGRPGGTSDLDVVVTTGYTISLPWDRSQRRTLADLAHESKEVRMWRLSAHPSYPHVRRTIGRYVGETIPDPVESQGIWSLTAFPSTFRRLFTLTVGDTETLYGGTYRDGTDNVWCVVNVSDVLGGRRLPLAKWLDRFDLPITHEPANYAVSRDHPVRRVFCEDISTVTTLLAAERFVDAAYRLAVTLMRRGSAPNRGKHNVPFAADVMRSGWESMTGAART